MSDTPKLAKGLEPAAGTEVATGDEVSAIDKTVNPMNDRKALYKKARENRELTTRQEDVDMPDAAAMRKAVAEAADDPEVLPIISTEAPDRYAAEESIDDPEYVEVPDHTDVHAEPKAEPIKPKKRPEKAKDLDYKAVDGRVKATINGAEYDVPEADVIAAGGLTQYQRQRAANIALEQSATQARALVEERKSLAQPQPSATADGKPPATGALDEEATLKDQREKVLEAVLNGEEKDLDEVIDGIRQSSASKPTASSTTVEQAERPASEVITDTYETTWKAQLQEANTMLSEDYSDVISDNDLRLIGDRKFKSLRADPANVGRLPMDMAREAGEFARNVSMRGARSETGDDTNKQLEARRERKRTLPQASTARQRTAAPEERKPTSPREHIKRLQQASGHGASRKYQ